MWQQFFFTFQNACFVNIFVKVMILKEEHLFWWCYWILMVTQVEEGCPLSSVDDIAGAVHHMLRIIEQEEEEQQQKQDADVAVATMCDVCT